METETQERSPLEAEPAQITSPGTGPDDAVAAEPGPADELPAEDVTDRLAAEFICLTEEFPHISSPAQLPDIVLETAASEGISLLDAYLRYRWQEEKRVAGATRQRQQAAQQSAGSLSRGAAQTPPEQDAFLRAFRSAL